MNILKRVIWYLRYLVKAKHVNGHGLHSPFMYQYVIDAVYPGKDNTDVTVINKVKNKLKKDSRKINTVNPGAGSALRKKSLRSIKSLAGGIGLPCKYGRLIGRTAAYFNVSRIVELGTGTGLSGLFLSLYNPGAKIITIEANNSLADLAEYNFKQADVHNIQVINDTFDSVFPGILNNIDNNFMVFIDGNHTIDATIRYAEMVMGKAGDNTVLVIDDIYWSEEMMEAWHTIKTWPDVKVTVDFFRMGMVFFRAGLSKQDFVIKY
ncbi:MAG: O-methyltransferase [Bacteroidales bacterium]